MQKPSKPADEEAAVHDPVQGQALSPWGRIDNTSIFLRQLPPPIARAFISCGPSQEPDAMLWRAVALRAALDALNHVVPLASGRRSQKRLDRARVVAEAREFFRSPDCAEDRETVFSLAGLDGRMLAALVRLEIERLEREQGPVELPPPSAYAHRELGPPGDMPGVEFEIVRPPSRPFTVERVRRRLSREDRETLYTINSYVNRRADHA